VPVMGSYQLSAVGSQPRIIHRFAPSLARGWHMPIDKHRELIADG
jgi:hypothetical protein